MVVAARSLWEPQQKNTQLRFRQDFNSFNPSLLHPPSSCPVPSLDGPSTKPEIKVAGVRQTEGSPLRASARQRKSEKASEWRHTTPSFPSAPLSDMSTFSVFREVLCKQLRHSARTPLLSGCCPQVSHVEIPEPEYASQLLPSFLPLMTQEQGDMAT